MNVYSLRLLSQLSHVYSLVYTVLIDWIMETERNCSLGIPNGKNGEMGNIKTPFYVRMWLSWLYLYYFYHVSVLGFPTSNAFDIKLMSDLFTLKQPMCLILTFLPDRWRAVKEQRNRLRGRRRERSWLKGGSHSTSTICLRINWSEPFALWLPLAHEKIHSVAHWALRSGSENVRYLSVLLDSTERKPPSCGSGWWSWRLRSSTSARNLRDRNMM